MAENNVIEIAIIPASRFGGADLWVYFSSMNPVFREEWGEKRATHKGEIYYIMDDLNKWARSLGLECFFYMG